ncbi:flagellar biosynthesis protein FlhF [Lentibacillus sediminis]|uniref:flagellar biosynthesis protein FlhF n=1 Tax=Lentibacillus sediminis TaxID=1940529 RepID=UPI000C1B9D10|nr:flagellar biosynthesis protein FlhF [Lentibacillus sediminis]
MKVKKYVAPTMPEAMKQVRKDFGSEAVILNSREVHSGGIFGLFKKVSIEVVAGLDKEPYRDASRKTGEVKPISQTNRQERGSSLSNEFLSEMKQLKKMVEYQTSRLPKEYEGGYQYLYEHLLEQEVEQKLATEITESLQKKHAGSGKRPDSETIMQDAAAHIKAQLDSMSFQGICGEKRIIQFIGPTGVGKTTTLAKLAARSMLRDDKKVAFITTDTYRIAAIEQLKTYAEILDIPVEVAYTMNDYREAVKRLNTYDLIFVDTAGRNFREEKYVRELEQHLDFGGGVDSYLVLSMTGKPKDLEEIYQQFADFPLTSLIFTKMDETTRFGSLLNMLLRHQIGVAYLTNGQEVPDDVIFATPEKIAELVAGANDA